MLHAYLLIGEIVGVHGVRGEVRIVPHTDEPQLLWKSGKLFWDNQGASPAKTEKGFLHKNIAIVKLEGVETPEAARTLRGKKLYAPREVFHLDEGQHFIADLIGCRVVDADNGEEYGKLEQISDFGASPIYEIRTNDGRLLLAPAIDQVVVREAPEEDLIEIRPLEGLFDA